MDVPLFHAFYPPFKFHLVVAFTLNFRGVYDYTDVNSPDETML